MTVTPVAFKTNSTSSITRPAGTATGDRMFVWVHGSGGVGDFTPPAGWTQHLAGGTGTGSYGVYSKVAQSGETDSTSWTWGTASRVRGMAVYRGVHATAPVDVISALASASSTTSVTPASISPAAGGLLVGMFGMTSLTSGTWSISNSMTVRQQDPMAFFVDQAVPSGATGSRTGTFTTSATLRGVLLVVAPSNQPPYAPVPTAPVGSVTINKDVLNRFSWPFADPDAGDSQSQFDLRYRPVSSGTWTVVTGITPNSFYDMPAGTLVAGDYEWQVRTYDALGVVGPYSASAFFTAASAPAVPTITAPTAGSTIATETAPLTWSTPSQTKYRVRKVADSAGSPNPAVVYYDSGEVTSSTARSVLLTFPTNNRVEHLQIQIQANGLWSSWASVNAAVSYTPPAAPAATVDDTSTAGAILVQATHPAPTGTQPAVTSVDVYRRRHLFDAAGNFTGYADTQYDPGGEDGVRRGAGLFPTAVFEDYAVASEGRYSYRVKAYGSNGTSSWSAWTEETSTVAGYFGGAFS